MLIKDNEGDWGICVAVWRGMKKGKPGIPGNFLFATNEGIEKLKSNITLHLTVKLNRI